MAKKSSGGSHSKAGRAAKSAVSGGNVRKRVHDLTLRAVRDNDLSISELPGLAKEVVQGAASGLDNSVSKSERSVLRQVVNGLTDAVAAAARATRATAAVAGERGATFVKRDVRRTAKDFRKLEDEVLKSLHLAGRSLTGAAKVELNTIVDEARRAGTKISAAAETAREAIVRSTLAVHAYPADTVSRYIDILQSTHDNVVLPIGMPLSPRLFVVENACAWLAWLLPAACCLLAGWLKWN